MSYLTRYFDNFFANPTPTLFDFPTIYSSDSKTLELSVPGFSDRDIKVVADKNVLKLSGKNSKGKTFYNTFSYRQNIDTQLTKATCRHGVLSVKLAFLNDTDTGQEIKVTTT